MLLDVAGFQNKRVIHELTWERVANTTGAAGNNIALDLLNEFLNNDFKGKLFSYQSHITYFIPIVIK